GPPGGDRHDATGGGARVELRTIRACGGTPSPPGPGSGADAGGRGDRSDVGVPPGVASVAVPAVLAGDREPGPAQPPAGADAPHAEVGEEPVVAVAFVASRHDDVDLPVEHEALHRRGRGTEPALPPFRGVDADDPD